MCWFSIAKYLLWAFNFVLWLGGVAVLGIGIYLVAGDGSQYVELGNINFYAASGSIFIIAGGSAFILGFIGCRGAKKEDTCMLGLYFCCLLVLFVLQVGIGIWALCNNESIRGEVTDQIKAVNLSESDTQTYQEMEQTMQCCGQANGCQDWADANQDQPYGCNCNKGDPYCVPLSSLPACAKSFPEASSSSYAYIYNQTCTSAVNKLVDDNLRLIAGIGLGIGLAEIVGMIFSMCMCQAIKENKGYA